MTTTWTRIGTLLVALAAAAAPALAADEAKMIEMTPATMKFDKVPGLPDCATAAILRGDPRTGPSWVMLKLGTGCRVPWHWHTPNEEMIAISGQGTIATKDGPALKLVPGAYASLPSHHVHQASCTRSCLFFASSDAAFDIHFVDAGGKEIPLDQAMKVPAAKPAVRPRKKR